MFIQFLQLHCLKLLIFSVFSPSFTLSHSLSRSYPLFSLIKPTVAFMNVNERIIWKIAKKSTRKNKLFQITVSQNTSP